MGLGSITLPSIQPQKAVMPQQWGSKRFPPRSLTHSWAHRSVLTSCYRCSACSFTSSATCCRLWIFLTVLMELMPAMAARTAGSTGRPRLRALYGICLAQAGSAQVAATPALPPSLPAAASAAPSPPLGAPWEGQMEIGCPSLQGTWPSPGWVGGFPLSRQDAWCLMGRTC